MNVKERQAYEWDEFYRLCDSDSPTSAYAVASEWF